MLFLSLNTVLGFVAGAVTAVVSPKVFAFVRKQVTSVEDKAKTVSVSAVEDAVKSAVDSVEKKL
jgi:hypothetical protein